MPVLIPNRPQRLTLASVINHPVTDLLVMVLILISVALLVIEEALELSHDSGVALVGEAITGIFAVELTLRYVVARKKARFFRRYWIDILAVLPLLRPLRFFRFFRLLRIFRLFHFGALLDRRVAVLRGAFRVNFYFLWVLLVMTAVMTIGAGVMIYLLESKAGVRFHSLRESMWWAVHTIIAAEPIGGVPSSTLGRLILVTLMLSGMSLFAVFTGIVSATMMERLKGRARMSELDIEEIENQLVICGWNASVRPLLAEIAVDDKLRDSPVVLVNELAERPNLDDTGIRSELIYYVQGDYTKLNVLRRAGVDRAARAVVVADDVHTHLAADRDARTVLAALTIERMNSEREIYCVVELMDEANRGHLEVAGVEVVILRHDLSGRALASACRHPEIMQVMMELLTLRQGEVIRRFPGPREPATFGALLAQLKREENALVIGVQSELGTRVNPAHDLVVKSSDWLIVIGGPPGASW